jgi:dethiobiotin synthetase
LSFFVAGTGTDVGKTIFSALMLRRYLGEARYHKPIQTGIDHDADHVKNLAEAHVDAIVPCSYEFPLPASPHFAAEAAGLEIEMAALVVSLKNLAGSNVIIELAGGIMVPLQRYFTNLDLMLQVGFPCVLVASTELGTVNHSVMTLRSLQQAGVQCAGVFFVGPDNNLFEDNVRTICEMTGAVYLGVFFHEGGSNLSERLRAAATTFDPHQTMKKLLQ